MAQHLDIVIRYGSDPSNVFPIALDDESRRFEDWIDRYMPLDSLFPWTSWNVDLDARQYIWKAQQATFDQDVTSVPVRGGLEPPNWTPPPRLRINQMYWPTGASRWSRGVFLLDDTEATKLQTAITAAETAGGTAFNDFYLTVWGTEDTTHGSLFQDPTSLKYRFLNLRIYPLELRRIAPSALTNPLWLLFVTDHRFNYRRSMGVAPATSDPSVTDIINGMPGSTNWDSGEVPAELLDRVDQGEWGTDNPSLGMWAYDALADSLGMRWVFDGDFFRLHSPDQATTVLASNSPADRPHLCGGDIASAQWPGLFHFRMPGRRSIEHQSGGPLASTHGPVYHYTVESDGSTTAEEPLNDDNTGTAHRRWIIDSSWDTVDQDNETTFTSDVAAWAVELADRYWAWNATRYDRTYSDIIPWAPSGFDDYILWSFGPAHTRPRLTVDVDDGGMSLPDVLETFEPLIWTRVASHPQDRLPRRVSHRSGSITRHSRNVQSIMFIVDAVTPDKTGEILYAFGPGEHPDTALDATVPLFFDDFDEYGTIAIGDRGLAQWNNRDGRFHVTNLIGDRIAICQFTLNAALAVTDATVQATVTTCSKPSLEGTTITLQNHAASTNEIFSGASGSKGSAYFDPDDNEWTIIQLEC